MNNNPDSYKRILRDQEIDKRIETLFLEGKLTFCTIIYLSPSFPSLFFPSWPKGGYVGECMLYSLRVTTADQPSFRSQPTKVRPNSSARIRMA